MRNMNSRREPGGNSYIDDEDLRRHAARETQAARSTGTSPWQEKGSFTGRHQGEAVEQSPEQLRAQQDLGERMRAGDGEHPIEQP